MTRIIRCPEECGYDADKLDWPALTETEQRWPRLFLGGGISGCHDWQREACERLQTADAELVVFNPRRDDYEDTPAGGRFQIAWEHRHLRRSQGHLFWFPPETLCPITLYELGRCATEPALFVGTDPEYKRRFDVIEQLKLVRAESFEVYDSLPRLLYHVVQWANTIAERAKHDRASRT